MRHTLALELLFVTILCYFLTACEGKGLPQKGSPVLKDYVRRPLDTSKDGAKKQEKRDQDMKRQLDAAFSGEK